MSYLSKDVFIHRRDENDNLLPIDVPIPELDGDVKIIPMPKGKINKVWSELKKDGVTTIEQDIKIIKEHVIEPKFSDKDFEAFKALEFNLLVNAVLRASGILKNDGESFPQ